MHHLNSWKSKSRDTAFSRDSHGLHFMPASAPLLHLPHANTTQMHPV